MPGSFDKLVETLVDNSHKTLKDLEEESVNNDEKLKIVEEIKTIFKENRYNIDSIKDINKDYPNKNWKIRKNLTCLYR